jgi:hypothetical protein
MQRNTSARSLRDSVEHGGLFLGREIAAQPSSGDYGSSHPEKDAGSIDRRRRTQPLPELRFSLPPSGPESSVIYLSLGSVPEGRYLQG